MPDGTLVGTRFDPPIAGMEKAAMAALGSVNMARSLSETGSRLVQLVLQVMAWV